MRLAVYLPLLLSLLAAPGARLLAGRCEPRLATWLLTLSAMVLAAAGTISLALLTLTGLLRVPELATLGQWSLGLAERKDPVELSVAAISGLLLALAAAAAARVLWDRCRSLAHAAMDAACLAATNGLVIVDDPVPEAFALPGLPGRVVVSTGMLDALDTSEREILLAHERAHLADHHYLFVALAQLGAATNPLLRPLAAAVAYTVERWADERAAAVTGDRRRVARTVGKAALAAHHSRTRSRVASAALGMFGRGTALSEAGPVPRRVAALLAPPLLPRAVPALVTMAVLGVTAWSTADAVQDAHVLLGFVGI
jgi:Zn-dependent protease with chaperone function